MKLQTLALGLLLAFDPVYAGETSTVDVGAFIKRDSFDDIKLSPNGDYIAATVKFEDRTALVVLRRSDKKVTAKVAAGRNTVVSDFWWVGPERIVASIAEKFGSLDKPQPTGELYAVNADGSKADILVGWRVEGNGPGTHIQTKKAEFVAAFLVDDLPTDDKNVIVEVWPFHEDPYTRAEKLDVYSGRRVPVARAPVRRGSFATDNKGIIRFAQGAGADNMRKLYYREGDGAEWQLISDEAVSGDVMSAVGFSADDKIAYLSADQAKGPDAIIAYDVASGERKVVLRDDNVDPHGVIYRNGTVIPIGVEFMDGKPRTVFLDEDSAEARLQHSLEAAFSGDRVRITSRTADGSLALVEVSSDRNPGDFYLFDTVKKNADHLISRATWFDIDKMAATQPIKLKTRDGLELHGYLTVPHGSSGKNMPLVVLPHGGPFGIKDVWSFDNEVQMLAAAGYGVLQVNFRGSGGYGRAHHDAGAKQWGGTMQDDLTDATRWAIQQSFADGNRICIYGASYGGYASLMGVAKEPLLYKCAAGYVGVYDLPMMHTHGDVQESRSGENYLKNWLGDRSEVASTSPNRIADRIKVPVFLAAGGEDKRAPIEHTKVMESALKKANVPVEALYYKTEGHGFYVEEHKREFYTKLLAFLARHLGGATAAAGAPVTGK